MQFDSLHFVAFLALTLGVVACVARRVNVRNMLLLGASYYFYGCWDARFLGLIVLSTAVDYCCGLFFNVRTVSLHPPRRSRGDRAVLLISLVANLGILGAFKYYGFFVRSAAELLSHFNITFEPAILEIVLPVGISFYTFQTLSYTIDLYRGQVTTERNPLTFALFVAYFPQLVAGPIERARHLLPQLQQEFRLQWPNISAGVHLMGYGFFKKVVIADNIGVVADQVFNNNEHSTLSVVLGTYAFAIQIYCDFSGYTDIARGAARCMGVDLMRNFNFPYFATSPRDFWRRWHISLSTWLRDYLYIPLGGSRHGVRRMYFALMITMILGGLWHGAAWTFVVWGVYHGVLLCVQRVMQPWLDKRAKPAAPWRNRVSFLLKVAVFFQFTCIGWLLFRADSIEQVGAMLSAFGNPLLLSLPGWQSNHVLTFISCFGVLFIVQLIQWNWRDYYFVMRMPVLVRALIYAAAILVFIWFGNFDGDQFIYFQF